MTTERAVASPWVIYRDATGGHVGQVWADAPNGALWVIPAMGGMPVAVRDWTSADEPDADQPALLDPEPAPDAWTDPRPALVGQWVTNQRWFDQHLTAGLGINPRAIYTACGTQLWADETSSGGTEDRCHGCTLADNEHRGIRP